MTTAAVRTQADLRAQFPQLQSGRAYLDNAAGGLIPARAIQTVTEHLTRYGSTNAMPGLPLVPGKK